MFSSRTLTHAVSRTLTRLSGPAPARALRFPAVRIATHTPLARTAAFSVAAARHNGKSGESDVALLQKLDGELAFEREMVESGGELERPAIVDEYLASSPFEIVDETGKEEVKLTRTYGDEKITVSFSVADLAFQDDMLPEEDDAFSDEDSTSNRAQNQALEGEESEGDESDDESLSPNHMTVVIEKPSKTAGALSIDVSVQDGSVVVEGLHYYGEAAQAHGASPAAVHGRGNVYTGPPFYTLDEGLQTSTEQFLEERGITAELASFVPEYINWKEQNEYMNWLKNVKAFVSA